MSSTRQPFLHENLIDGVDASLPAHLIGHKWRTQHNMRLTPVLEQIPHKVEFERNGLASSDDIRGMVVVPSGTEGFGRLLVLTKDSVKTLENGAAYVTGLAYDSTYRRWSHVLYNGSMYYCNELNPIRRNNLSSDVALDGAPAARYVSVWYDHLVAAGVKVGSQSFPNRVMFSDLYNFSSWTPVATNEADHYDLVEWQQLDYPYTGITGIGKLGGTLWVYTPTAIIPIRYVGLPKVIQVDEDRILTRIGNTFKYTLVCLDRVHFFYDGIEKNFFAFDGAQTVPIGDPVRAYLQTYMHPSTVYQQQMWAYVDVDYREIWWLFVSTASTSTTFDKAVVFNYRLKKWFTASVENIHAFCGYFNNYQIQGELSGTVGQQAGAIGELGLLQSSTPRLFGAPGGKVYREEATTDAPVQLLPADNPVLESADFHYGDIRTEKENDIMFINATYFETGGQIIQPIAVSPVLGLTNEDITAYLNTELADIIRAEQQAQYYTYVTIPGTLYFWVQAAGQFALINGTEIIQASNPPTTVTFVAQGASVDVMAGLGNVATIQNGGSVNSYIELKIKGRPYLGQLVDWGGVDAAGRWTPKIQDSLLTYQPVVGRVLRYRFEGKNVRGLVFSAYSETIRAKGAEK